MQTIGKKFLKEQEKEIENAAKQHEKSILLLESGDKNIDKTRQILGWDEDIQEAQIKLGESIETQKIIEKFGKNILNFKDLVTFCIDNNYAFNYLGKYRGPISKELVTKIEEYGKEKDLQLKYLKDNLIILAPLEYFNSKPKVRIKNSFGELALLEKVTNEHKENTQTIFKILHNEGKRNRIRDFIYSILFTHTKIVNSTFAMLIPLFVFLIMQLIFHYSDFSIQSLMNWSKLIFTAGFLTFGIRQLVTSNREGPTLYFEDDNYKNTSENRNFLTSYLYWNSSFFQSGKHHYSDSYIYKLPWLRKLVNRKMYVGKAILALLFIGISYYTYTANVMRKFEKAKCDVLLYEDCEEHGRTYLVKTGSFSYEYKK